MINESKISEELEDLITVSREELINYPKNKTLSKTHLAKKVILKILNKQPKGIGFSWANGFLAQSLEYHHKEFQENEDIEALSRYYDNWYDKGLPIDNLDNTMNGYSLIYLYEQTGDKKYKKMIVSLANYLLVHKKDDLNNLPYRPESTNYIYIDSLGMICPFLARYGNKTDNKQATDLAVTQLVNFFEYGFDSKKNLPYHAFNLDGEKKGIIGWGRSVGWLLIGIVDTLEYLDNDNPNYNCLVKKFTELIETVLKYQKENGSFSWQLQAIEGMDDSSATSMIGYSIIKALKLELIDTKYYSDIQKIIDFLLNVTQEGYVMQSSSECRGLGMYPQVHGWYPWSQGPSTSIITIYQGLDNSL